MNFCKIGWHKWEKQYEYIKTPEIKGDGYFPSYAPRIVSIIQYRVCKKCGKKEKEAQDVYTGRGIITGYPDWRIERW